ncbi:MAG: TetR/AcrR family transcriptional regulator C-terminal domain-containing protein [Micrococcales bacterium]|nr:TetR/AcrR family transcriptional regulator C-terminal domain-containing protein [Micrococcales bacterium]MCL2667425.1 TetR/AcrR family transcriptional regulator C-terminal domain-containing protein [Micrococcales bacterium]
MAKTPREPLSHDKVLAAAVALCDAEGVAALTMRRLGAALGVEAMSLYHYLPAKEALLDGVVETVFAEIDAAVTDVEPADGWRARIREQFLAARRVMLRHPWMPPLLASRTSVPPNLFFYYDAILRTMVEAGFSYHIAHRALHAFGSMPLGFVQEPFGPAMTSEDDDAFEEHMAALAQSLPHLTAMMESEAHDTDDPTMGWCDSQVEFEFTLDLLLDGLDRLRG